MQIIPVIDIKHGVAVHAQQGDRKNYQPLSTPLCTSCQINDVVQAYLNLYPFSKIYLADLDAIMGNGNNQQRIRLLLSNYPQINFIIDCGSLNTYDNTVNATHIYGTESVKTGKIQSLIMQRQNFILSLDFDAQGNMMGETALFKSQAIWPQELIIMTLNRVGKNKGADLTKLKHYRKHYAHHDFIAAGGIRHLQDLIELKKIGIQQALLASALHNKMISAAEIEHFTH